MSLHFFQLKKVPKHVDRENMLLLWLALFKANTEQELQRIDALGVPEMSEAINAFHEITASTEFLELARMREKAFYDEIGALDHAKRKAERKGMAKGITKGREEGKTAITRTLASGALRKGMSIDDVVEVFGLSRDEVQALANESR